MQNAIICTIFLMTLLYRQYNAVLHTTNTVQCSDCRAHNTLTLLHTITFILLSHCEITDRTMKIKI